MTMAAPHCSKQYVVYIQMSVHLNYHIYILRSTQKPIVLQTFWTSTLFQKLNPSVEAPTSKIVDLLREHVADSKKGAEFSSAFKQLLDGQSEKILLTMSTKLAGLPFTWKFYGEEVDKKEVCAQRISPLSHLIKLPLMTNLSILS